MYSAQTHLESLYRNAAQYPRDLSVKNGIDFCSNDYLSLKAHPFIRARMLRVFSETKAWCGTGSRLVSGHSVAIHHLEETFRHFVGSECALFFGSGYLANLAVIASIGKGCAIFSDEHNHASLIDGIKLAHGEKTIYRHNDMQHLEELLKKPQRVPKVIITESVFSTNGAIADLAELNALAKKYAAVLVVDEAHATGILGKNGAGCMSAIGNCVDNIITTHSCGKALASYGAFVACSEKIAAIIKNQSRQFMCTTAPPPYLVAHVQAILELVHNEPELRKQLLENVAHAHGIMATKTPIIAVPIGDDVRALSIKNHLTEDGFDIAVFRYPSVKKQHAQLRITLHRSNTRDDIERLRQKLEELL